MRRTSDNPRLSIIVGITFLTIGLFFFIFGIAGASSPANPAECGSETMQPGDSCTHITLGGTSGGTSTDYNYDQQVQDNTSGRTGTAVGLMILGVLFCGIGIMGLSNGIKASQPPSKPRPPSAN